MRSPSESDEATSATEVLAPTSKAANRYSSGGNESVVIVPLFVGTSTGIVSACERTAPSSDGLGEGSCNAMTFDAPLANRAALLT